MLDDWVKGLTTPTGVGIDLVRVSTLRELDERMQGVFVKKTFTLREQALAESRSDKWVFLAGRFAAKEAVFKATAHLLPEKTYDFRQVETLRAEDGSPYVVCGESLRDILSRAGVGSLLISITNEDDYAMALVQAVSGK